MTQAPPTEPGQQRRPWRGGLRSLRTALGLFTIIPVRAVPEIGRDEASRAVLWLPVVGVLLAVPAAGVLLAVEAGGHATPRLLLAAALAVGTLAALTGGLHLDGLADTADGLGSRRPRDQALAIMRRSDVGPFGVVTLLLAVVVQITALATIAPGWPAVVRGVAAAAAGLLAADLLRRAAKRRLGGMTGDVFGALIEVSTTTVLLVLALAG